MSKKRKTFCDELREAIESAEISRYRLAEETGINAATLCRFIKGKGGLSVGGLDKIAAVLGLHVSVEAKPKAKGT
jgi:transcriptional regulator with XRE-family HTH domain